MLGIDEDKIDAKSIHHGQPLRRVGDNERSVDAIAGVQFVSDLLTVHDISLSTSSKGLRPESCWSQHSVKVPSYLAFITGRCATRNAGREPLAGTALPLAVLTRFDNT